MANRTVAVRLTAEVGSYVQGIKNATQATKDLTSSTLDTAKKNKQSLTQIGLGFTAVGVAAAAGVAAAVGRFAEFDKAMSGVQAATHESAAAMDNLREAALEAGARTAFSATEAADGIEQLAKAGVATADILNGGLNGALDLAAAGGLAVGDAAEIAATALTQFKLEGAQVPHVADLLAAAAGKAQGGVSDMGMALKQAGLVASQTGLTIEETTAGLASFASAGLLGSDAGTSFKSMLQRLTPQSEEAADKMAALGISAYDAQGNFIGLEAFAGNLQESLKDLTVEQRNSAMATIFGSDAVRAASVLYSQGAAGIADWTAKVNDAGYAQETAAIQLDNLKGDFEAFMGSVETALIRTGQAGDGLARNAVQSATSVVNAYNELPQAAQSATLGLGAFIAAAGSASGAFLLLVPRIAETREHLNTLRTEMPRTTAAMTSLGKAAGIAGVILGTAVAIDQLATALADTPPGVGALTDGLADFIRTGKATGDVARLLGEDLSGLSSVIDEASKTKYLDLNTFSGGVTGIEEARQELKALDQTLAAMVTSGNGVQAARIVLDTGVSSAEAAKHLPGYTDALASMSGQSKLAATAQDGLEGAVTSSTGAVIEQAKSVSDLMGELQELTGMVLGLRDANRGYEAAIDAASDAVKENGRTLDINTEAGRANEEALDAIATSANEVLQTMIDSGEPLDSVSTKLGKQREALIQAATRFGMTKREAEAYADTVLRIPDKATTTVQTVGMVTGREQADALRRAILNIPSFKRVTVRYDEVMGTTVQRGDFAGRVVERASGGWVSGPGTGTSDSIPARLSDGEFVVNARSAAQHAQLLEAMNSNRFASGGWVNGRASSGSAAGGSSSGSRAFIEGGLTIVGRVDRDDATNALHKLRDEAFRLDYA